MPNSQAHRVTFRARALAVAVALALSASTASATTWVVDAAAGPGSNFTTISAALSAAAPGDIIVVKAGAYFENVIVNIGVTIVGWNATTYPMTVPANPFQDVVWGGLLVQNIPLGQRVVVSGMVFARPTTAGGATFGVYQCFGAVVFDRMFAPNGGMYIGDATDVVLQDVRIRHVPGSDPAVPGVFVTNSFVQANDLDATAGDLGGEPNFLNQAPAALEVVDGAVVSLARPKLIGAYGGGPWVTSPATPGGGAAIRCSNAAVSVIGNGSGLYYLIGGQGGERGVGSAANIPSGFGAPAIQVENNGVVSLKGAPTPISGQAGVNNAGGPLGTIFPSTLGLNGGVVQTNPQAPATLRYLGATGAGATAFLQYQSGGAFYPFALFFMPDVDLQIFAPSVQFLGGNPLDSLLVISGLAPASRTFNLGLNYPSTLVGTTGATMLIQGADYIAGTYFTSNPITVTLP
jgi:hypothetical protein